MVDAKNAFNSVNRVVGLWNARIYWPRCSRFLFNIYRGFSSLWVNENTEPLYSKEGVTQGDPLSMCFYAIALIPLIRSLRGQGRWVQSWYADDSACIGPLDKVKEWFRMLLERGPSFGYFPEPAKCVVVVDPRFKDTAVAMFSDIGVKVVSGNRFLGGYVGDENGYIEFIEKKVKLWVSCVNSLATAARSQPQAAFASLLKSLQCEWLFLMRVCPDCSSMFEPLRDAIRDVFWPSLFGGSIDEREADLFSIPTRLGGMGVRDPVKLSVKAFEASRTGSERILSFMKDGVHFLVNDHLEIFVQASKNNRRLQVNLDESILNEILNSFDEGKARAIRRAIDGKCSNWLNVTPVSSFGFALSEREFRDALALRYYRPIVALPAMCDGCGDPTSVNHALNCRKGGLIIRRHNEVRDALGEILAMAYGNQIIKEPIISEADVSKNTPGLVADLAVRGLWQYQSEALLDIRVMDTDADSYSQRPVTAVIRSAEEDKKRKYNSAVEARCASFSPFVVSVDGFVGMEAGCVIKRTAEVLSLKWEKSYSQVIDYVRTSLSFAIIRATGLCLRGSRMPWRSGRGFEDGVGLPICGL